MFYSSSFVDNTKFGLISFLRTIYPTIYYQTSFLPFLLRCKTSVQLTLHVNQFLRLKSCYKNINDFYKGFVIFFITEVSNLKQLFPYMYKVPGCLSVCRKDSR